MTIRYSDTAGSNTSPYDTWAKAATDPQTIVDLATAGDINYYRGSKTLTVPIDIDINTGGTTTGYIKHIGCAADGSIDGTKYVLDGNNAATNCMAAGGVSDYHWFENFEFKNATSHGVDDNGELDYSVFINCLAHNNGGTGFHTTGYAQIVLLCKSYSNTGSGLYPNSKSKYIFCAFYNNSSYGMEGSSATADLVIYGCLFHNNTTGNLRYGIDVCLINCVIDGSGVGVGIYNDRNVVIGNRITNNTTGIDFTSDTAVCGWNYFHDNTADVSNATLAYNIPYHEALTNHLMSAGIDGTNKVDVDADDGYNDRTNDDFNLKASRTLIRTEIDLEVGS